MKKPKQRHPRHEFDVVTVTHKGETIWKRYGDGNIIIAGPHENPRAALARRLLPPRKDGTGMKLSYSVANIMGQARLCSTEAQARLFNKGYYWAVIENSVTVVSLHMTEQAAGTAKKKLENRPESKR